MKNQKPSIHLTALHGWLNDPCAPGFLSHLNLYHLGFQWAPDRITWGDISWGVATSRDLLRWSVSNKPSLSPDPSVYAYDSASIFTGCMVDQGPRGETGIATCVYTSVSQLPLHFSRPYPRGAETVSLATTVDGREWKRCKGNPIDLLPPADVDVTGWRDPYVAAWPALDGVLGKAGPQPGLYSILSGGIRGVSPTSFLYSVNPSNLSEWKYIGPIALPGISKKSCPLQKWARDLGINWEVTNFLSSSVTAGDQTIVRDILICGIEGVSASEDDKQTRGEFRATHSQTWLSGSLVKTDERVDLKWTAAGEMDYGALYAANSFFDPAVKSHIVIAWLLEDDMSEALREEQNWAGVLSLPRRMGLWALENVVGALVSGLGEISSVEVVGKTEKEAIGRAEAAREGVTVIGFSAMPDARLEDLRAEVVGEFDVGGSGIRYSEAVGPNMAFTFDKELPAVEVKLSTIVDSEAVSDGRYESHGTRAEGSHCHNVDSGEVGLILDHGNSQFTSITFSPFTESLTINRSYSSSASGIKRYSESAPHTLFRFASQSLETLDLHVFFDHSIIEVFANGRTALSTRVYPESRAVYGVKLLSQPVSCKMWSLH
ncbi:hypothetical protein TD95_002571 [Thielaviopsis punctulata]|uniref:Glycosyl hydrolase family 32 N-terminal domain-containing protein n=1 Tax=Thielaviopsis punctulata TaxID=72032 RepID=A0A0F4ZKK1_9PEZI|nr:hypothetical protein TD95_002571 [Thielaviopsis punctulata]